MSDYEGRTPAIYLKHVAVSRVQTCRKQFAAGQEARCEETVRYDVLGQSLDWDEATALLANLADAVSGDDAPAEPKFKHRWEV